MWLRVPSAGVGHDEHRRGELARQVGDGEPLGVVPHEEPAGALDDDQVAVGGQSADPGRAVVQVERGQSAAPRGGGGGERVGEAGVLVQVGDTGQPAYVVEVARAAFGRAGLGRLDDRDPRAAGGGERREGGRDDGLADPGAGAAHHQDAHGTTL